MSSAVQAFGEFLGQKGLRLTSQRELILRQALAMKGHFEAEALHYELRKKKGHRVSKASVYRTLPLLVEAGLLREVEFVDRHAHYEQLSPAHQHEHLVCTECGKVIEFRRPSVERTLRQVAREHGFEDESHKIEITGLCKECRRQKE